ncbi:MAG TPA: hypothetical protein VOB72_18530 [Candidatus Dormibacteraeota bacterium]|nr:hypothetical protein [Candidatus Dormibacteraeota bacterium]
MSATDRYEAELTAKLRGVTREFAYWELQSRAGAPLEKHHRQIRRVTATLRLVANCVSEDLTTPAGRRRAALLVLDLHQVWDLFRRKLALRCVPWFARPLIAADDFAWACYEPAAAAAVRGGVDPGRVSEPPLVFLSADAVARAHLRGESYAGLIADGLFGPALVPALRELPVPLVAVPWYQVEHVPDALAIGHEVGHLVERDLDLTSTLRGLLARALRDEAEARLPAWTAWLSEVFADVYGCLAAGPAYAGWLLDLLAEAAPARPAGAGGDGWGRYPPPDVRTAVILACVRTLGFGSAAGELGAGWSWAADGGGRTSFLEDAEHVVAAVLDGSYPMFADSGLRSVLSFSTIEQEAVEDEAVRLLRGGELVRGDIRILLAAGALAFRSDPRRFRSGRVGGRVLDRAVRLRQRGVRARRARISIPPAVLAADRRAGRRLFELLAYDPKWISSRPATT